MAAGNETPPLTVRVNPLRTDGESLSETLRAKGFEAEVILDGMALKLRGSGVLADETEKKGLFSVQDVSSMKMIQALAPEKGDTVLDLCAAPGGKSLAAAERMGNEGRVISCDIYDHKLRLIERAAQRLGVTIVETRKNDGAVFNEEFAGIADKVIVDAPCSGLGVVRRKPEIKLHTYGKDLEHLADLQLQILETAARYLKPEGTMIYSTCTVSEIENRGVIDRFLKKNKNFLRRRKNSFFHILTMLTAFISAPCGDLSEKNNDEKEGEIRLHFCSRSPQRMIFRCKNGIHCV